MYPRYDWSYAHPMMNDGAFGWVAALVPLIVLGAVIGLVVYLVRTYVAHSRTASDTRDPLDIARERYAKGEITKAEFTEIKHELK